MKDKDLKLDTLNQIKETADDQRMRDLEAQLDEIINRSQEDSIGPAPIPTKITPVSEEDYDEDYAIRTYGPESDLEYYGDRISDISNELKYQSLVDALEEMDRNEGQEE